MRNEGMSLPCPSFPCETQKTGETSVPSVSQNPCPVTRYASSTGNVLWHSGCDGQRPGVRRREKMASRTARSGWPHGLPHGRLAGRWRVRHSLRRQRDRLDRPFMHGSVPNHRWFSIPKHAQSSTFPICMEGLIRFPLAGSVVRDRAETFRISPPNTDMRKVGPGAYRVLRRPKKRCKQAVLARRLPIPDGYAADQMGKVEQRNPLQKPGGDDADV